MPIKTIKHAVTHLGLANIKSIIFAIEILGTFKGRLASDKFSDVDFWKHSIAGGIIASNTPGLWECGFRLGLFGRLLRNLGVLAIRQFMPGEFDKILELIDQEKRLLKTHARRY